MVSSRYPPVGSKISCEETPEGLKYTWSNDTLGKTYIFPLAFLMFWLVGWAFGEIMVIINLINLIATNQAVSLFLVAWLGGWTVGGYFAARTVYLALRPPKPAVLELKGGEIIYETGTIKFRLQSRGNFAQKEELSTNKKYQVPLQEMQNLKTERIGENLRLSFDYRSQRIELGKNLGEPDKEWLYEVLKIHK